MRSLAYITNARLPTASAHGLQIARMCNAFAGAGTRVSLYFQRPNNPFTDQLLGSYYGLSEAFEHEEISSEELLPALARVLPGRAGAALELLHSFIWSFLAVLRARRRRHDTYFARAPVIAFWLALFRLPMIFEVHRLHKGLQGVMTRFLARRSESIQLVVALTPFIAGTLEAMGYPKEKILVSQNGFDPAAFARLADTTRRDARAALRLPQEALIVGYIGRLTTLNQDKGVEKLIEAAALLTDKNILLLAVGGPLSEEPRLREHARKSGLPPERLSFVDKVPSADVPLWIRACDVLTIPWTWSEYSAYETSPLKLFEYMAAGAAIVASDLPSLNLYIVNEVNGLLVPPGDAAQLSRALERLLTNPDLAAGLGLQAKASAALRSWDHRAEQILHYGSARMSA